MDERLQELSFLPTDGRSGSSSSSSSSLPNGDSSGAPQCNGVLPTHRTHLRVSEAHGLQLLSALRSFRERGLLFDFTIKAQEHSFPCHRCVLASCSDFFRAMFEVDMRERDDGSVTLGNQPPSAVHFFLDFAYSGEAIITDSNVDMLFQLASFLQVSVLSKACSEFLIGTLDISNCLALLGLAEVYGSVSLLQRANEFVVQNFHELSSTQDFLDMQVNVLDGCLRSDALSMSSEEAVVMSLLRWIRHDVTGRRKLLPRLLSLTRPQQLPAPALKALCDSDDLLRGDDACLALLSEAQGRQSQHAGLLPDARRATTQTYIYVHKTEENGEIRHTFCYCLETDHWRDLGTGQQQGPGPQGQGTGQQQGPGPQGQGTGQQQGPGPQGQGTGQQQGPGPQGQGTGQQQGPGPQGQGTAMVPDPPGSYLTSYAEKMFVTGGCRGNCCRAVRLHVAEPFHDATDEVWCYCPVSGTVASVPAMSHPRTMHTAVTCLDRVYVIGGRTRGSRGGALSLLEVEYYDPLSRTWYSASALPTAIYYPEATACGGIIYALGSEVEITDSFNPSLDCFFRYDAKQDQWSRLVAEFGHFFHATLVKAVSSDDTLYLCDLSTYKVYSFCPETCVWKGEGSFECAGFNAGAVGMRDRIYILGGDYSPDEITDEVQVFYRGRSQWEEVVPMPRALTEFHCQLISFNRYRDPWGENRNTA